MNDEITALPESDINELATTSFQHLLSTKTQGKSRK
jgi:hypothetical protein